jgi:hypothetical protein
MDITIRFPGGKRVDAHLGTHVVHTDQPIAGGGEDSAPAPFDLFLASLATCAGIYVLGFCQARHPYRRHLTDSARVARGDHARAGATATRSCARPRAAR